MLGAYHTNCHDISLQLMQRFTSSQQYSFQSWPREKFAPLLSCRAYQEGSLQASSLMHALHFSNSANIKALPPVVEVVLEPGDKDILRSLVSSVVGHTRYTLFTLSESNNS